MAVESCKNACFCSFWCKLSNIARREFPLYPENIVYICRYEPAYFHGPGMVVLEIDVPSGFDADLEGEFTDITLSKKSEIRNQKTVVLYYDEVLLFLSAFFFCVCQKSFFPVVWESGDSDKNNQILVSACALAPFVSNLTNLLLRLKLHNSAIMLH